MRSGGCHALVAPAGAAISAQPPSNKPPCTSYVADRISTLESPPALKIREPYSRSTGSADNNDPRPACSDRVYCRVYRPIVRYTGNLGLFGISGIPVYPET